MSFEHLRKKKIDLPLQVLFMKNRTELDYEAHLANVTNAINSEYSYGFPEDLSQNDSRACAGIPVFLTAGDYRIVYIPKNGYINVNNYGREIVRILTPDEKFLVEYSLYSCPNPQIKSAGEHLNKYQKDKEKLSNHFNYAPNSNRFPKST
jgi:hypothetical protein